MYSYIIVDDEPLIRKGTKKKLESMQEELTCAGEASNGEMALALIQEKDPDLIITDMKMPVMDGSALLPVLSAEYPEKYIIVISGYRDFEYMQYALRANSIDYLVKPFSREAILDAAGRAVSNLKDRADQKRKLEISESEKEILKYEYDRILLKNMVLGNQGGSMVPSSQRLKLLNEIQCYILITIDLNLPFPEEDLTAFLAERQTLAQPVLFGSQKGETVGFLLLFFRNFLQKDSLSIVCSYIELLDGFFSGKAMKAVYGISLMHTSLEELHDAFLETGSALDEMTANPLQNYQVFSGDPREDISLNWNRKEELLFRIENGEKEEAAALLNELFRYLKAVLCPLREAKNYCLALTEELRDLIPREYLTNAAPGSLTIMNQLALIFSFPELESCFRQLFSNLTGLFQDAKIYSAPDVTENIRHYIDKNYAGDLTVEFVASLFHLNRSYLSSCFKKKTGKSFVEYVNAVRLAHAKELLVSTDKKMYQVAQMAGYENVKYFFRVFKKAEGLTPEQYRKKNSCRSH